MKYDQENWCTWPHQVLGQRDTISCIQTVVHTHSSPSTWSSAAFISSQMINAFPNVEMSNCVPSHPITLN